MPRFFIYRNMYNVEDSRKEERDIRGLGTEIV